MTRYSGEDLGQDSPVLCLHIVCVHQHPSSSASGSCVRRSTVDAYTSTLNTVCQTINTTFRQCVVGHHIGLHTFLCHLVKEFLLLFVTIWYSLCRSSPVKRHSRNLRPASAQRV